MAKGRTAAGAQVRVLESAETMVLRCEGDEVNCRTAGPRRALLKPFEAILG